MQNTWMWLTGNPFSVLPAFLFLLKKCLNLFAPFCFPNLCWPQSCHLPHWRRYAGDLVIFLGEGECSNSLILSRHLWLHRIPSLFGRNSPYTFKSIDIMAPLDKTSCGSDFWSCSLSVWFWSYYFSHSPPPSGKDYKKRWSWFLYRILSRLFAFAGDFLEACWNSIDPKITA